MGIDIDSLSPAYQAQALAKIRQQDKAREITPTKNKSEETAVKRPKYGNEKTSVNGIKFDSKKEANRYTELIAELSAGIIDDLRLQVEYTLQGAYTTVDGERIRAIRYIADFTYRRGWRLIVEDVKSKATKTRVYEIKKKLMREKYGIEVKEV